MDSVKTPVLEISSISKKLGGRQILNSITLNVYPGEVFGFLGPNGSGKTTTIKLMLGLLRVESGSIRICGHDVTDDFEEAMGYIGGIIENPEMYKYLTGRENLEQYARMYGGIGPGRIEEVAALVGLSDRIDDKIAKYSLGMRQRLGLAQALLNKPRLLVLDEPTNGLDPAGIKDLRDTLRELAHRESVAVFISSHQLAELDLICDRIGIINNGILLDTLTIEEVRNAGSGAGPLITVEIDPSTAEKLPPFLESMRTDDPSKLTGQTEREKIPDLIYALCDAGVRVYSVSSARHSIEEVFLSMTSEYAPGGRS